jgi:hypothetical protein
MTELDEGIAQTGGLRRQRFMIGVRTRFSPRIRVRSSGSSADSGNRDFARPDLVWCDEHRGRRSKWVSIPQTPAAIADPP